MHVIRHDLIYRYWWFHYGFFPDCSLKYLQAWIISRFRNHCSQVRPAPCFSPHHWQLRKSIPAQENPYIKPPPQLHLCMQAAVQELVPFSNTWPGKNNLICTHCACGLRELSEVSCDVLGSGPKDLRTSFNHRMSILWDVRLEKSHRTNLKPTESRWHRIFVGLVWIPGGFCSNTSPLCPPCPAGSLGPQPGNSPSYPPVPHSWKPATGRACWSDLSQSHSPGHGWCQLSPPPVGYKKITWNLKNTTWKITATMLPTTAFSPASLVSSLLICARLVRISTALGTIVWAELGCHIPRLLLLGLLTAFTAVQYVFAWCKKRQSLSQAPSFLRRSTTLCKVLATSNIHTLQATTWLDKLHSAPCKGLIKKEAYTKYCIQAVTSAAQNSQGAQGHFCRYTESLGSKCSSQNKLCLNKDLGVVGNLWQLKKFGLEHIQNFSFRHRDEKDDWLDFA